MLRRALIQYTEKFQKREREREMLIPLLLNDILSGNMMFYLLLESKLLSIVECTLL